MKDSEYLLCLLMMSLVTADGLTVTMKAPLISVLRGVNVTIPCEFSDFTPGEIINVHWTKLQNGKNLEVFYFTPERPQSSRQGFHMEEKSKILKGNAALHIPQVQFSDGGEYTCTVIVAEETREGRSSLQVSAEPSAALTLEDAVTVYLGSEKVVFCKVKDFYPKDINIRWVRYEKESSELVVLDKGTCIGEAITNTDGTFTRTSQLILLPAKDDDGYKYSCVVKHRSLPQDLMKDFNVTVSSDFIKEKDKDHFVGLMICLGFMVLVMLSCSLLIYQIYKKDAPKLFNIIGPVYMTHEKPMTLTCSITECKPKPLQITWLKKDRNDLENILVTWNSKDQTNINDEIHQVTEIKHNHNAYSFLSILSMKPNVMEDDGATYICRTFHPPTGQHAEEELVMVVTAVPVLDPIKRAEDKVHLGDTMKLSCRIHSFYPSPIEITWYTEDKQLLPSGTRDVQSDPSGLYHVTSSISYSPTLKDLGKTFTCKVRHESTGALRTTTWTLEDLE